MPDHPPAPPAPSDPEGWTAIDHVQLAMPVGAETTAVGFYQGVLGLRQVPKPPRLAARGGCWFEAGAVRLHLGVDPDFHPARKAHPALRVQGLDRRAQDWAAAGVALRWDDEIPGVRRGYVNDPFGNRIELIDAGPD